MPSPLARDKECPLSTSNYTTRVIERPKLDSWYALPSPVPSSRRFISVNDLIRLHADFPHCLWTDCGWTWYYDGLDGTVRNPWSFMSSREFVCELKAAREAAIQRDAAGAL